MKSQAPSESVIGIVIVFWQAAHNCNFILHYRLVCGLRNKKLLWWLFTKKKLTLKEALEEILAAEAADQSTSVPEPNHPVKGQHAP